MFLLCYYCDGEFMRFKKIYIEITNACNLNCAFCIKNRRKVEFMSLKNYKFIIDKISKWTKEIYLHVLGEPLMHQNILDFIEYASSRGLFVNITTNGYLIDNIKGCDKIHRLNISLHSYDKIYKIDFDAYLKKIFDVVDTIRNKTFVSLRLWVDNDNTKKTLDYINNRYEVSIDRLDKNTKFKIASNLMIDTFHEFIWPDLNNNYYSERGTCRGLVDHIGILSDGTVVPCCLDSMGKIDLGNIYCEELDEILKKPIVKEMLDGFKKNIKCQELCKHCGFLQTDEK